MTRCKAEATMYYDDGKLFQRNRCMLEKGHKGKHKVAFGFSIVQWAEMLLKEEKKA